MEITSAISASELLLEGKISLEKESPNESWKPQQPPVHQPPIQEHTGEHMSLENWERLLQNHKEVAAVIQEIHRELHTSVPGGFQAERLTEMLEERHGGKGWGKSSRVSKLRDAIAPTFGKSKRISETYGVLEVRRCNCERNGRGAHDPSSQELGPYNH
ncbi:hypothetical protein KY290_007628 [Solanum tuberosum]|uniref:Uncharacterized protein n=1 Tax=Solanum tuberosum TaxID=4113 RepID=A0ABQ7W690_SOLTU|nr:hypothetical protein KY290_007628 [Solanum tuberosum]